MYSAYNAKRRQLPLLAIPKIGNLLGVQALASNAENTMYRLRSILANACRSGSEG